MEELGYDQVMAELDDFYGSSPLSLSPAAPYDSNNNKHTDLKRNSKGHEMLLDAPLSPVEIPATRAALPDHELRESPELAELQSNPWTEKPQGPQEFDLPDALPMAVAEDIPEEDTLKLTPQPPDLSFLIHTTLSPGVSQVIRNSHEQELSELPQTLQDQSPILENTQNIPDASCPEPEPEQETSAFIVDGKAADEPPVESAESWPSSSPPSEPTSQEEQQPTDNVQENHVAPMRSELELPNINRVYAVPRLEDETQVTPGASLPRNAELPGLGEQETLPSLHNFEYSGSAPQLPTYVPSNMMLQAASEVLPPHATPIAASSSHRSELHAEMRAEEDAASSPIRPAPVSAFRDRLNSTPGQLAQSSPSLEWSLDRYGNILFEEEESDEESGTELPKPKETSPEDSAIEVAKAPPRRRIQPSKVRVDPNKPHWAQLKKPVAKKPPPRIKQVPVQRTVPSPPAPGFRFPPAPTVSTRASAAPNGEPRPTRSIKLEETGSSLSDSSSRSPSPPADDRASIPYGHHAAPFPPSRPPQPPQYTRAPSARLQLQQKPRPKPAKTRKPHQNLLASMVPPEFDNTGGSFVEKALHENEVTMDGSPPPPGQQGKVSRKRAYAPEDDEIAYDEEGHIITAPRRPVRVPVPVPAPKRVKTEVKPRVQPKAPMNKELMSIVGATVMADMQPNSPRKTRNQKREMDAVAPNASAAAKRRHTKQGKLIAG